MKGSMRIEDVMTLKFDSSNIKVIRDDYNGAFKPTVGQGTPHPSGLGVMPGTGSMNPLGGNQQGQQVQQSTAPQARGVLVRIAATHSGLVTRNNGFYLPDKMRAGATSWTDIYPKPIQIHHDEQQDPIGRVVASRYVETVGPVMDRFKNSVLRDATGRQTGVANEQFWNDFVSPKTSFMRKMDMIQMMDSILDDPHYAGLGFIELTADITDPEAIAKILDGRYLTGSVGAVTDRAVCSTCKMDWLEDGQCDHKPGREYEGKKMFIVAGSLSYDEYSFVNRPADRHSGVIEINYGDIKNSVETEARDSTRYQSEVRLSDKLEDGSMKVENQSAGASEENKDVSAETPSSDTAAIVVDNTTETIVEDSKETDLVVALLDKAFGEKPELTTDETLALYNSLELETRLDAAAMAKLPRSAFVGPCRTFPVVDEAHYKAVAKFSIKHGDHPLTLSDGAKKFASALERKRKALGFAVLTDEDKLSATGAEPAEAVVVVQVEDKEQKKLNISISIEAGEANDAEKMALAKELLSQLVGTLGKDAVAQAAVEAELALDRSVEDSLVAEVEKYETRSASLSDELSALRRELASLLTDVATLEDQLIDSKSNSLQLKRDHVRVLATLKGGETKLDDAALTQLSDEVLDTTMKSLATEVDIQKIADSLNSGLSKTPDIKVEPPAGETEPPAEQSKPKKTPTFASITMVDEVYRRILVNEGNFDKAKQFKDEMIREGLYPAHKSE